MLYEECLRLGNVDSVVVVVVLVLVVVVLLFLFFSFYSRDMHPSITMYTFTHSLFFLFFLCTIRF